MKGDGVPQDDVLAYMWTTLAADQGTESASRRRDMLSARMTPAEVTQAKRQANEWLVRRDTQGEEIAGVQMPDF